MGMATASNLLDIFKTCMDSLCEKNKSKVSMHGPNVNKSHLPVFNAEQKNSELCLASWC